MKEFAENLVDVVQANVQEMFTPVPEYLIKDEEGNTQLDNAIKHGVWKRVLHLMQGINEDDKSLIKIYTAALNARQLNNFSPEPYLMECVKQSILKKRSLERIDGQMLLEAKHRDWEIVQLMIAKHTNHLFLVGIPIGNKCSSGKYLLEEAFLAKQWEILHGLLDSCDVGETFMSQCSWLLLELVKSVHENEKTMVPLIEKILVKNQEPDITGVLPQSDRLIKAYIDEAISHAITTDNKNILSLFWKMQTKKDGYRHWFLHSRQAVDIRDRNNDFWSSCVPGLLLTGFFDKDSAFFSMPKELIGMILMLSAGGFIVDRCKTDDYFRFFSAPITLTKTHRRLHQVLNVNQCISGKMALDNFCHLYFANPSILGNVKDEDRIFIDKLMALSQSNMNEDIVFGVHGTVYKDAIQFVDKKFEKGDFSETGLVLRLKNHDFISDRDLLALKIKYSKQCVAALCKEFGFGWKESADSNRLINDMRDMCEQFKNVPAKQFYEAIKERCEHYFVGRYLGPELVIKKTGTVLLLQKYLSFNDGDIMQMCQKHAVSLDEDFVMLGSIPGM